MKRLPNRAALGIKGADRLQDLMRGALSRLRLPQVILLAAIAVIIVLVIVFLYR